MTSKLPWKKLLPRKFSNHVSNLCFWLKSSKIGTSVMFVKNFLNAMIRNIEIHNILDVIKISKSMKLNKCIH